MDSPRTPPQSPIPPPKPARTTLPLRKNSDCDSPTCDKSTQIEESFVDGNILAIFRKRKTPEDDRTQGITTIQNIYEHDLEKNKEVVRSSSRVNKSMYVELHKHSSNEQFGVTKLKEKYEISTSTTTDQLEENDTKIVERTSVETHPDKVPLLTKEQLELLSTKYSRESLDASRKQNNVSVHPTYPVALSRVSSPSQGITKAELLTKRRLNDINSEEAKVKVISEPQFPRIVKSIEETDESDFTFDDDHKIVRRSDSEDSDKTVKQFLSEIEVMEPKPAKKRPTGLRRIFSGVFSSKDKSKKNDERHKGKNSNSYGDDGAANGHQSFTAFDRNAEHRHTTGSYHSYRKGSEPLYVNTNRSYASNISAPVRYATDSPDQQPANFDEMQYNRMIQNRSQQQQQQPHQAEEYVCMHNGPALTAKQRLANSASKYIDDNTSSSSNTLSSENRSYVDNSPQVTSKLPKVQNASRPGRPTVAPRVSGRTSAPTVGYGDRIEREMYANTPERFTETPPRASETRPNLQLVKPRAVIPLNTERQLPNPYRGTQRQPNDELPSPKATTTNALINSPSGKSQSNSPRTLERNMNREVAKYLPNKNNVVLEETYGTVLDSLKPVGAQLKTTRQPNHTQIAESLRARSLSPERNVSSPTSFDSRAPKSPTMLEGSKLRLPPNREKICLTPRLTSPIDKRISAEKIIATELLKPRPIKGTDMALSPNQSTQSPAAFDYPDNVQVIRNKSLERAGHNGRINGRTSYERPPSGQPQLKRTNSLDQNATLPLQSRERVYYDNYQRPSTHMPYGVDRSMSLQRNSVRVPVSPTKEETKQMLQAYYLKQRQFDGSREDPYSSGITKTQLLTELQPRASQSLQALPGSSMRSPTPIILMRSQPSPSGGQMYHVRSSTPQLSPQTRSMTPINAMPISPSQLSPSKQQVKQDVEAFYWQEVRKLKDKQDQELYNRQMQMVSLQEAENYRRSRSASPAVARNGRSMSLPRTPGHTPRQLRQNDIYGYMRSPQYQQMPIHEEVQTGDSQFVCYLTPSEFNAIQVQRSRQMSQSQQDGEQIRNHPKFVRGSPQRNTIGPVNVSLRQDGQAEGEAQTYAPIFKRGSLVGNVPVVPESNSPKDFNKRVSFSSAQNVSPVWPTKNGFTQSPPQRRIDKRDTLEDEVFLPNQEAQPRPEPEQVVYGQKQIYPRTLQQQQLLRQQQQQQQLLQQQQQRQFQQQQQQQQLLQQQRVVTDGTYGKTAETGRNAVFQQRIAAEIIARQRQEELYGRAKENGQRSQQQIARAEQQIVPEQTNNDPKKSAQQRAAELYSKRKETSPKKQSQSEDPYGRSQGAAPLRNLEDDAYGRTDNKQITMSNKVCDIYGQIHDSSQYGQVQQSGVLYGHLQRSPMADGTASHFVRGTRLTASVGDVYRRRQEVEAPNRPLPPLPGQRIAAHYVLTSRRTGPVSDTESGSEAGEVQKILQTGRQGQRVNDGRNGFEEEWNADGKSGRSLAGSEPGSGRGENDVSESRGRGRSARREDPRRHTLTGDQHYPMASQGGPLSRTMDLEVGYLGPLPRAYPPPSNAMLFDDDPGIMSEVETSSTGFRRGGKQRSSLPVVRTPSKTLERPLGLVFLQYRNETKRALLPNEITSIDTVKALFVRSFPKQLSMEYLDSPLVKIYIHDSSKDMFYELEDLRSHLRDIRDRSVLRLFESADVTGGLPMAGTGIAGGVGHFEDQSYFSEPEFDSEYQHQHIHKSKTSGGKNAPPYYMGSASLPRGGLLRAYSPAVGAPIPSDRLKPLPSGAPAKPQRTYSGGSRSIDGSLDRCAPFQRPLYNIPDGYMSSPERGSRGGYEDPYYSQYSGRSGSITPVIDEETSDTELLDDTYAMYGVKIPAGGPRAAPRTQFSAPASVPYDATRIRVEHMERQLANLTGLVQKALTQAPPTPRDYLQVPAGRENYRTDKSVSFEKSVSFSDEPPDMNSPKQHSPQHAERDRLKPAPPPKPASLSPAQYDSGRLIYRDLQLTPEMYNQLRGLQKKAKDLRSEVRNLRRMSQAQAHSVRETIRDTFIKIRTMLLIGGEQVWQAGVDQEKVRLSREEDLYKQEMLRLETDLSDLESTVEELRGNVINRKTRVNMSDVENMALVLSKSSKTVADLKLRFPGLQDSMKNFLSTEMERVVREETFLKEEPERLESALRRCKKLTGTLVTLKRLASVQEQRLPCSNMPNDGRLSPNSTETPPITPQSAQNSKPPSGARVGQIFVGGDSGNTSDSSQRPENALDALLDELQTFSRPHAATVSTQLPQSTNYASDTSSNDPPAVPIKGITTSQSGQFSHPPSMSEIGRKGSMDSATFLPNQNLTVSITTGSLRRLHSYPSGSDTDNSPPIQPLQRVDMKNATKPPIPERNAELLQHVTAGRRVPPPPPPRTSSRSPLASPTSPSLPPRSPAAGLQHIQNVQNMVEKQPSQFEMATQNLGLGTLKRNVPGRSSLKEKSQTLPRNIGSNLQVQTLAIEEQKTISASNSSSCESVNSQDGSKKSGNRKEELEQRHQELLKKQKALQDQYARLQQLQRGNNALTVVPPAPDLLLKKTGSESNLLQKMGLQMAAAQMTGSLTHLPNTSSVSTSTLTTSTKDATQDSPNINSSSTTNKVYETDIL